MNTSTVHRKTGKTEVTNTTLPMHLASAMMRFRSRSSLLLVAAALVFGGILSAGCASTKVVDSTKKSVRSEINQLTSSRPADVTLLTGKEVLEIRKLRVKSDSTFGCKVEDKIETRSGVMENSKRISFHTSKISEILVYGKGVFKFEKVEKKVSATGKPYRTEINREAEKYPVRVTYRNGT